MRNPLCRHPHRTRAAALLLAMWAMFVLTAGVMVWASFVKQTLSVATENFADTEARAMAHSGIALGLHPLVTKETPVLNMKADADPGFSVRMIGEGAKLNVNTLLIGEDPKKIELFKRWLEYRGIAVEERERMVDCMLDWLDADNIARLNGQEDEKSYHPPNRGQFLNVDEIKEVAATEPLTSQSGWKDDLTIHSQGTIDLTSADAHILRLLPGMNDPGIERFLQWRRGADQTDGTLDDPPLDKLEVAQAFLGLDKRTFGGLGGLIGLRDNTWHITATGRAGKVHRQIEVVARKGGQKPQILDWKE